MQKLVAVSVQGSNHVQAHQNALKAYLIFRCHESDLYKISSGRFWMQMKFAQKIDMRHH